MTATQRALLEDTRLSVQARLMGLWLSTQDDWLPMYRDAWRRLLGRGPRGLPSKDAVARYLGELEAHHYVERRSGGKGNPDSFRFNCQRNADPMGDSVPVARTVNPKASSPRGRLRGPPPPPVSSSSSSTVGEVETRAHEVTEAEAFKGCRDSMRDYLALRVEDHLQHGYAQRVAQALAGGSENFWRDGTGTALPEDQRTEVLAEAFNELAAGDETGSHFREAPGGFGNLRSKVRYLVKVRMGQERDTKRGATNDGPNTRGNPGGGGGKAGRKGRPPGQGTLRTE